MACSFSASLDSSRLEGQGVESGAILILEIDQRGDGDSPTSRPRRETGPRRWDRSVVVLAPLGTGPRLALGRGHGSDADATSGHPPPPSQSGSRPDPASARSSPPPAPRP